MLIIDKETAEGSTISPQLTASSKELVKNLLVLVSKRGDIFVSYLGTDPEVFSAPATITRDVNYEETDKEFGMLTSQIKEAQSTGILHVLLPAECLPHFCCL